MFVQQANISNENHTNDMDALCFDLTSLLSSFYFHPSRFSRSSRSSCLLVSLSLARYFLSFFLSLCNGEKTEIDDVMQRKPLWYHSAHTHKLRNSYRKRPDLNCVHYASQCAREKERLHYQCKCSICINFNINSLLRYWISIEIKGKSVRWR